PVEVNMSRDFRLVAPFLRARRLRRSICDSMTLRRAALTLATVGIVLIQLHLPAANAQTTYTAIEVTTLSEGGSRMLRGLSDAGEVVGGAKLGATQQAFVASRGQPNVFVGLPGSDHSAATGIDPAGQVVGYANTAVAVRAFSTTKGGVAIDLGTLPGDSG